VLITSAEHYGAVLNLDFDYRKYLDTLERDGMNFTRVFSGAYVEPEGAFNIARNTLAPLPGRLVCPWLRSDQPGYANGGNKFDLSKWDDAYFDRLKDFVACAAKRGVVVEITLFCPMYEDKQWRLSPMNAANNVNGLGAIARTDVHTLERHGGLLEVQEALTRKIVTELNAFDNVFFELCNEPYFGGVTLPWQHRIADVIVETEQRLPQRHLIAQNIANKSARITDPHPAVSIFNFHYATPPDTVALNYHLNKAIGDNSVIKGGVPAGGTARALVQPGRAMAIYVRDDGQSKVRPPVAGEAVAGPVVLQIELAPGVWQAEWFDTKTGRIAGAARIEGGGVRPLEAPKFETDIALRLVRE
jgi:hypothetical protein